ncbi:hypothetical protein [Kribbella sp. NPDC051620]|uniref:hypothetical protein n=1 Tax=Kribbella sp. NPDC051620 TaxID=3364120 RepID=UPI0037A6E73B
MTFNDLPTNWLTRPLTDPVLAANAVDLFVTEAERRQGVLAALICDGRARFRTSILLDLPRDAPLASARSCIRALAPLVPVLQGRPDGALILALGRPEPDPPSDHDWTQAAIQTCQTASIRLLAFYLATPTNLHAVPLPTPPRPPGPTSPTRHTAPRPPPQHCPPGTPLAGRLERSRGQRTPRGRNWMLIRGPM